MLFLYCLLNTSIFVLGKKADWFRLVLLTLFNNLKTNCEMRVSSPNYTVKTISTVPTIQNRFLITRKTSPNDNVWMLWVDIQDKILIGSHLWVLKSIKEQWKEGRRETMTQRMRGGWVHFTHFKGGFVCVCNKLHKYNYGWSQVSSNVSTHLNIPHPQCTSMAPQSQETRYQCLWSTVQ